jgi:cytochrome P450 family 6
MLNLKKNSGDLFAEFYEKFKSKKFIGAYMFYQPILIVNDPELIQDVMIKSFNSFHDRPMPADAAKKYPLIGHLFNVRGQKWRDLRVKLSPTFTSGKLKAMFPIINECADVLQKYVGKELENGRNIMEFRDLFARLTTNIISSVAFGIENDSINDRENVFRKMGMKLFEPSARNTFVNFMALLSPDLFVKSGVDPFGKDISDFMNSIVKQTVEYREKNKVERNDFMQLLIKLKNEGYIPVDKNDEQEAEHQKEENKFSKLSMDDLTANVFLFFVAGKNSFLILLFFKNFKIF